MFCLFDQLLTDLDNFLDRFSILTAEAGYSVFLVGGSVRDQLMSRPLHDIDLTTDAPTSEIKNLLGAVGVDSLYTLGEKFGTIGARVGETTVEVTTFRSQDEAPPEGGVTAALYTDLAHRDFTVNAIARDLATGELHDPHDGKLDIKHHLIRAVGSPDDRFTEDPLRMLRAVRLASELGFYIDRPTRESIRELGHLLQGVARERIGAELDRILVSDRPGEGINELDSLGLLQYTIPEILEMHEMERGPLHYKEVYPHTLKVVERVEPDLILRWAALLHDVAKPRTYGITDGEVHFFGHEQVGARMARDALLRLRRPAEVVDQVSQLISEHLRIGVYDPSWTDGAVRRFIRETVPITERLFKLSRADITSSRPQRVAAAIAKVDALYRRCEEIKAEEEVEKITSPLDGNEIMQLFGGRPGPWIGRVKDHLLSLVLDGTLAKDDKEAAELAARTFMALMQTGEDG